MKGEWIEMESSIRKILLISLVGFFISRLLITGVQNNEIVEETIERREHSKEAIYRGNTMRIVSVNGVPGTLYKNIVRDKSLTLDYFLNIRYGLTYCDMVKEIGTPDGSIGSGLIREFYIIGEYYIVFPLGGNSTSDTKIEFLSVCNDEGILCDINYAPSEEMNGKVKEEESYFMNMSTGKSFLQKEEVSISSFFEFKSTTQYEEVVKAIGEPQGKLPNGCLYYIAGDRYIVFPKGYEENSARLNELRVYSSKGVQYRLVYLE